MPIINISEKDILRSRIIDPGWYRVRVDGCNEKTSSKGTSQNFFMEGTVLFNADNGSKEFAGTPTPVSWLFNEGAISFAVGFLKSCGAQIGEKGGRFELNDAVGKELDVFIENDVYEGRTVNKINHKYRSADPSVVAVG